jgi:hypothetical protein
MSDPRKGGVIIPEKTVGSGFWIQVRDFERSFYFGTKIESARLFATREVLKTYRCVYKYFDLNPSMISEPIVDGKTMPKKTYMIGAKSFMSSLCHLVD